MNPDEYDWVTGLEPPAVMAERKAVQQEEDDAKANLPWYMRDYEADEMELMGDTELDQLLDDFYGEPAGELKRKTPEGTSPVERYHHESPSGVPDSHSVSATDTIPYDGQSACKSRDPRLYWKHPFGCGCNQRIAFCSGQNHHRA